MSREFTTVPQPIRAWISVPVSLIIVGHLISMFLWSMSSNSGPWAAMEGPPTPGEPPQFAQVVSDKITKHYLQAIKMTNKYHFRSNIPVQPATYFEVRLRDGDGHTISTLTFPDKNANVWVRHRQAILARGLSDDQPVTPPPGEAIPAPNQQVKMVKILDSTEPRYLTIKEVEEHLIPRDRPVSAPSELSILLARSYVRHLCRVKGAAAGELIRHWREPYPLSVLFDEQLASDSFEEVQTNFGVFPR